MSGPKIIDIAATRERERLRIVSLCNRVDALSGRSEFANRTREIREAARDATSIYRLIELTQTAGRQLEFVRSELSRMRREEIEDASARRSADQAVSALIRELRGRCTGEVLRNQLAAAEAGADAGEKLRIYEEVRNQLAGVAAPSVPEAEIRDWIESLGSPKVDRVPAPEVVRWRLELQRIQVELELLNAEGVVAELKDFAGRVEAEKDEARRRLLLDGLRWEVAGHLATLREREQRRSRAAEWESALFRFPFVDQAEWGGRFARVAEMTAEEFRTLGEEVDLALDAAIKTGAAHLAREAVLDALLHLGYELRAGMETALIDEGKVIVKRPGEETYGVELSAPNPDQPSLIKAQVVRMRGPQATTPDALQADKEREIAWCEDSKAMQDALADRGIETEIKAARPAGNTPVPVAIAAEDLENRAETKKRPQLQWET